jgi:hypothetical protein
MRARDRAVASVTTTLVGTSIFADHACVEAADLGAGLEQVADVVARHLRARPHRQAVELELADLGIGADLHRAAEQAAQRDHAARDRRASMIAETEPNRGCARAGRWSPRARGPRRARDGGARPAARPARPSNSRRRSRSGSGACAERRDVVGAVAQLEAPACGSRARGRAGRARARGSARAAPRTPGTSSARRSRSSRAAARRWELARARAPAARTGRRARAGA